MGDTQRKQTEDEVASERNRLRMLIDNVPDPMYLKDLHNRYVVVNQALVRLLGATAPEALLGKTDHDFFPPDVAASFQSKERRVMQTGQPMINHEDIVHSVSSGELHRISTTQVAVRDSTGAIVGLAGIGRDITERQRSQEAQLARLGRIQQQQQAIVRLATHETVWLGDFEAAARTVTETVVTTMEVERCSIWLLSDDGRELFCSDLFERTSERQSSGLVLRADTYPWYFQAMRSGRIIDAHDALADPRTNAFSEAYLIPLGIASMLDASIRVSGRLAGVVCHEHVGQPRRWMEDEIAFAGAVADQVAQAILNCERKRGEEALRASQQRLELALRGADIGMYDWNLRTGGIVVDERYAGMLGYTVEELNLLGIEAWRDLVHPDDRVKEMEALERELADGFPLVDTEYRMRTAPLRKQGTTAVGDWKWVLDRGKVVEWDSDGKPTRVSGTHLDITPRKRAEEETIKLQAQVVEAQKMKAIGQLAAGVAHDFNNLLTSINGYAELLIGKMPPGDVRGGMAEKILISGQRAADLVSQLLAFGRKQMIAPKVLDLNDLVRRMEPMLSHTIREDIDLATDLDCDLQHIRMEPAQVEQIIVNLSLNARDAMPRGGTMTIRTANVTLDGAVVHGHPEVQAGAYVLLAISDTGIGMTGEVKQHLFEPFFTTKGVGKGTGLGLASVYGIVKQNGGEIVVESEPGRGTILSIYLPSAGGEAPSAGARVQVAAAAPSGNPLAKTGDYRETILLLEDHEGVLELVEHILREQGYRVMTARNGPQALALALAGEHSGEIRLLVTDVVLPGMSGREVAERLLPVCPGLKVLFMSGYTDDVIRHHRVPETGVAFLPKPFNPAEMARKVRQMLDSPLAERPPCAPLRRQGTTAEPVSIPAAIRAEVAGGKPSRTTPGRAARPEP